MRRAARTAPPIVALLARILTPPGWRETLERRLGAPAPTVVSTDGSARELEAGRIVSGRVVDAGPDRLTLATTAGRLELRHLTVRYALP